MHKLSITADDYGPHPFINRGIIEAVKANCVSSVCVLANEYSMPGHIYNCAEEIDALVQAIGERNVGIGVHLSITSGMPLQPSADLILGQVPDGGFFHNITNLKLGKSDKHKAALKAELKAQITRVKQALEPHGKQIDHVNCHHNITSLFGPYYDLLLELLSEMNLKVPLRTPYPISRHPKYDDDFDHSKMLAEGKIRAARIIDNNVENIGKLAKLIFQKNLLRRRRNKTIKAGHRCVDLLFDNYYGQPGTREIIRTFEVFKWSKKDLQGEFVVHLGKGDPRFVQPTLNGIVTDYFYTRVDELNTLLAMDIEMVAEEYGVKLCPMSDL